MGCAGIRRQRGSAIVTFWLLIPFVLAQCADVWTTVTALAMGCGEANPIYQGSPVHITTVKSTATMGIGIGVWYLYRKGYTRYAKLILWTGILVAFGAAAWNLSIMPYCER